MAVEFFLPRPGISTYPAIVSRNNVEDAKDVDDNFPYNLPSIRGELFQRALPVIGKI